MSSKTNTAETIEQRIQAEEAELEQLIKQAERDIAARRGRIAALKEAGRLASGDNPWEAPEVGKE